MSKLPVRTKAPRRKACYVGAPAHFALELACQHLYDAFCKTKGPSGIYLVGSCLERPDFRDVDVRLMLPDDEFRKLFPRVAHLSNASWEMDPRWIIMTTTISRWLREQTGLPIDFQFQPMSFANKHHSGRRNSMGMKYAPPEGEER